MTHTENPTPTALISLGGCTQLDIKTFDDRIAFAFTGKGIISGGEIELLHDQVARMVSHARTRRNWKSGPSWSTPILSVWWERGLSDGEPAFLNIDLFQVHGCVLLGRAFVSDDEAEKLLADIAGRLSHGRAHERTR